MATSFALELEYERPHCFSSQICVVDYDTNWIDIYALVKCYLDITGDIEVKYVDDENDEVSLNSEDEYSLAKELARKRGDTLRLRIYRIYRWPAPPKTAEKKVTSPRSPQPGSRYDSVTGSALADADELAGVRGGDSKLAYISVSQSTMDDTTKRPPDKFVDTIVQDILQGLDGSVVVEEDTEEVRATHRKIRQGIKDKNHSSNIEWSSSSVRVPAAPNGEFVDKVVQGVLAGLNGAELKTALMEKKKSEPVLHPNIVCDKCDKKIYGIRYKCAHCPDFDLCEKCEPLPCHNECHVFLKIKKPAFGDLGKRHDGQSKSLLEAPVYQDDERIASQDEGEESWIQAEAKVRQMKKVFQEPRQFGSCCSPLVPHGTLRPVKRQKVEGSSSTELIIEKEAIPKQDRSCFLKERNAALIADVNIPLGTHLQPGTKFTKIWNIRNTGQIPFCTEGKLKFLWGNIPNSNKGTPTILIEPGETGSASVECSAPARQGVYQGTWRLIDMLGNEFGDRLSCQIIVDEPEILEPKEDDLSSINEQMLYIQEEEEDTLEACDAVANLQPDQSDTSAPNKIISNNTELLTAHDILSFEMLKICKKEDNDGNTEEYNDIENEVQGLTTPNNTPCGMTPCMSPVPQLDPESLSNKMSDHGKERVEGDAEERTHSTSSDDMVIINNEEEADSSSNSSDDDRDSLLDDFCVVPLPDCFDLDKPLEECLLSNSTILVDNQSQEASTPLDSQDTSSPLTFEEAPLETTPDVDTMLATSHTLVQTPLIPLVAAMTIQPPDEIVPHRIVSSHSGTYSAPEIVLDVSVSEDDNPERGFVVSPDEDAVFPEGQSLVRQVLTSENVEVTDGEQEQEVESSDEEQLVEEPPCVKERSASSGYRETDMDGPEVFHDAEDHRREVMNTPQEEGDEIPRGGERDDESDISGLGAYMLPETQDQAREILGYTASRAVSVASSVMRQAYDVANNVATALLVPPSPPQPIPPPTHDVYDTSRSPMDTLIEMGFANREKNQELLYKYKNDVNECVPELLAEEVDNWHLSRH